MSSVLLQGSSGSWMCQHDVDVIINCLVIRPLFPGGCVNDHLALDKGLFVLYLCSNETKKQRIV